MIPCRSLDVQGKKTITLFNKVDVGAAIRMRDSMADHTLEGFGQNRGRSGGFKGSFWGKSFLKSRFMWKSFLPIRRLARSS